MSATTKDERDRHAPLESVLPPLAARQTATATRQSPEVNTLQATVGNAALAADLGKGTLEESSRLLRVQSTYGNAAASGMAVGREDTPGGIRPMLEQTAFSGPGEPLAPGLRKETETRVGADLGGVRVHRNEGADRAARMVEATAFTLGQNIAFSRGAFQPETEAGKRLIAHEAVHTVQQRGATWAIRGISNPHDRSEREADAIASGAARTPRESAAGILQRVPAPPGSAIYDRSKIAIGDVADMLITKSGNTYAVPVSTTSVTVSESSVTHIRWDLYDPSDSRLSGFSTKPADANAKTKLFSFNAATFSSVKQGRHTLRCAGLDKSDKSVVYADRSFYVWTSTPASMQDLTTLNAVKAAPSTHSFGEVGAAYARAMMLEHQASLASGGPGTVQGNQCPTPVPQGVAQQDCTTYVLLVLEKAFNAKGKGADWKKVMAAARKASGAALKGTEVLKALETEAGWKGIFWSPDPRNPADSLSEHSSAYKDMVLKTGKYYDINVDKTKSIVEYRRTSATKQETWTNLDRLKKVPLGVIAAKGGTHMTLILNGQVYEVHWDKPANDPNVIEATPLEKWIWNSGVIVMPMDDFTKAFP